MNYESDIGCYSNKSICLLIVFGLPASGKTTFIHWLKQKHNKYISDNNICIEGISFDDILFSLSENKTINSNSITFEPSLWKSSQSLCKDKIKTLIMNTIESAYKKKNECHLIYIEDVMHYNSMRQSYINIAKHYKIVYVQLFLNINTDLCLKNNFERKGFEKIPDEVIKNLNDKFEMPNGDHYLVTLEALSEDMMKNALHDILNQWKSFIFKKQIDNNDASHLSSEHCLDLRLRKCVTEAVSFLSEKNIKDKERKLSYIKNINQLKQIFLKTSLLSNFKIKEVEDIVSCFKEQLNELLASIIV